MPASIVIVGSGPGGSVLARVLARQGHRITLVEKERHPRFALGESTTPLANLALERLAAAHDLPDLHHLAAHGRWLRHLPELRRGLKRGFTFYHHRPGRPFSNGAGNEARALVAASPEDALADSHWLRSDVDHHLMRRARAEGVEVRQGLELTECRRTGSGGRWRLRGRRRSEQGRRQTVELEADFVVDATGPAGFLPRALRLTDSTAEPFTRSGLVYGHFRHVRPFAEVAAAAGATLPPGPYPDDSGAVHHLLDEGWMYVLRFDPPGSDPPGPDTPVPDPPGPGREAGDGDAARVSAGILFEGGLPQGSPEELWRRTVARYPSLGAQFGSARPLFPLRSLDRVQHRRARAAGEGWALLPHTFAFVDPLFSTGLAWTFLGVERLADLFGRARGVLPDAGELARYRALLAAEADRLDRLISLAYRARNAFPLLVAVSLLYFAPVSFAESRRRLVDGGDDPWQGFLGVGDPVFDRLFERAPERLERALAGDTSEEACQHWVRDGITPRDVAGLADPGRRNLHPVDLELLVERAPLLGLTPEQLRGRLHRLRRRD